MIDFDHDEGGLPYGAITVDPSSAATVPRSITGAVQKALLEAVPSDQAVTGSQSPSMVARLVALGLSDALAFTASEHTGSPQDLGGLHLFYYVQRPSPGSGSTAPWIQRGTHASRGPAEHGWVFYDLHGESSLRTLAPDSTIDEIESTFWPRDPSDGWDRAILQAMRLVELEPGWDTYDAAAIDKDAIDLAVRSLSTLRATGAPAPIVGPSPAGGVVLQWYLSHVEFTMEIGAQEFEYILAEPGTHEIREHGTLPISELDRFLLSRGNDLVNSWQE